MRTAVAILNWNGFNLLNKFLPSVIKNTPDDVDIYIIDNGSTDKSIDFINTNFPLVKIINLDNNYGYAKGYNLGIKKIDADIICLLNNDVEVTKNWTEPVIELFKSEKNTAIIQPKLLDYNNRKMFDYAGAAGGFLDKFGYPYCHGRIYNKIEADNGQYDTISKIFWACGACFFIRKEVFEVVGGFDDNYWAHMEEIDLCWRIQNLGYHVKYHYKSRVYHLNAGTLNVSDSNKTYYNFRNQLYTLTKNCKENLFLLLFFKFFIDLLLSIFFLLTKGIKHTLAIYRAYISFYRKLQELMILRKNLNREIVHYNVYSIIFYFLGLKRLKKV